jgi:hypothetical protein
MSQTDFKTYTEHVGSGKTLGKDDATGGIREFAAVNQVNAHEKGLSYIQGIRRYKIALVYCFCVSLGAMLNGLDGSVRPGSLTPADIIDPRPGHLNPHVQKGVRVSE